MPKGQTYKVSEQDIAQMIKWSDEGFTQRQIAELIGTVQSNVQRHLQKVSVEPVEAVEMLGPFEAFQASDATPVDASIESDSLANLIGIKASLEDYASQANRLLQRLAILDGELDTAIAMLSDSRMVTSLASTVTTLESALDNAQIALDKARKDYRQEREARVSDTQLQAHKE